MKEETIKKGESKKIVLDHFKSFIKWFKNKIEVEIKNKDYRFFDTMNCFEGNIVSFDDLLEKYIVFSKESFIPDFRGEGSFKENELIRMKTIIWLTEIIDMNSLMDIAMFLAFETITINKGDTKEFFRLLDIWNSDENGEVIISFTDWLLNSLSDALILMKHEKTKSTKCILTLTKLMKLISKESKELIIKDSSFFTNDFNQFLHSSKNSSINLDFQWFKSGLLKNVVYFFYSYLEEGMSISSILNDLKSIIEASWNLDHSNCPIPEFAKTKNINRKLFKQVLVTFQDFLKKYEFNECCELKEFVFPKFKLQVSFDAYSLKHKTLVKYVFTKNNRLNFGCIINLLTCYFLLKKKKYPIEKLVIYNPICMYSFSLSICILKKYNFFHSWRKILLEYTQCENNDLRKA